MLKISLLTALLFSSTYVFPAAAVAVDPRGINHEALKIAAGWAATGGVDPVKTMQEFSTINKVCRAATVPAYQFAKFEKEMKQLLHKHGVEKILLSTEVLENEARTRYFIEKYPAALSGINENGTTPLHVAAAYNLLPALQLLLDYGTQLSINVQDGMGCTPLHVACGNGCLEVTQCLVEAGASLNARDHYECVPLHYAAWKGHASVIHYLLQAQEEPEVDAVEVSALTPLHGAALQGRTAAVHALLNHGADESLLSTRFRSPLHNAAASGCIPTLKALLRRTTLDPLATDELHMNALHIAASYGRVEVIRTLLKEYKDWSAKINFLFQATAAGTALHSAVAKGRADSVRELLAYIGFLSDEARVDFYDEFMKIETEEGYTPLELAILTGHCEVLDALLESLPTEEMRRALVNHSSSRGGSPLLAAAAKGDVVALQRLVVAGADVSQEVAGFTALHLAAAHKHAPFIRMLLNYFSTTERRKAFIHQAVSEAGNTALHLSVEQSSEEYDEGFAATLQELIDAGADLTLPNSQGRTALHQACSKRKRSAVRSLLGAFARDERRIAFAQQVDNEGYTALHLASIQGDAETVALLLTRLPNGALKEVFINQPIPLTGLTALHIAALHGHIAVVSALLAAGAWHHIPTRCGWTVLHYAVDSNHPRVVKLLIEAGVDLNAQITGDEQREGWTALHIAAKKGLGEIARLLLEAGADFTIENEGGRDPLYVAQCGQFSSQKHEVVTLLRQYRDRVRE